MFGGTYDVSQFDGFGGYGHQGGGGGGGGYGFDSHIAHQVDARTGEYEELNVDEAVHTVRDELHRNNFDPSLLIDDVMRDVTWENNVEEQLFIIFEGLSRDLALVANEMENEIVASKRKVKRADLALISDLDNHTDKLNQVRGAVDEIKTRFDQASEGAVRIGERLAASENERRRIEMGIELLNYISWFEKSPITNYSDLPSKTTQEIREILPQNLQRKNFGEISQVINELRKVLLDINASDVQNAQKNVVRLSEVLEDKLLSEFESAVTDLMEDPGQLILAETCRNLIIWLQCYQSGAALHKRFIHCAVEKSIPKPASSVALEKVGGASTSAWSKLSSGVKALGTKIKDLGGNKENDVSGMNDEEEEYYMDAQDSLSEHFGSIGRVCQQQFGLIRDIFPQHVVAKITRMLIQRIFTDSAFGIQSRVDAVLSPKPPLPQLPLSDYLDSLANVREKLSALFVILLEYCSHPALIGMGSEAALTRVTSAPSSNNFTSARSTKAVSFALDAAAAAAATSAALNAPGAIASASDALLDEMNEKVKSDNEVKAFLQEQIMGVLSSYLVDYFDKEMAFLRSQYVEGLRRVVDDDKGPSKVSAGTVLQMPRFRAEKMKSIGSLVKTVANNYYVSNVVATTTDSVIRMENIGRDDKKLPARIKELYLLQLGFLIDGVFYPYVQACTTMLLRSAVAAPKNSVLPPLEYIQALATVYSGVTLLKKNFDEVFAPSMTSVPNLVVVCKEARRNSLKPLESAAKESMHAWTMCVILHMERTLAAMQEPSDFHPQGVRGQNEPSAACDVVCQSFMKVISTVQGYKSDLIGIDLVETLWKPLGQQFVGTLLSHLRRQKISQEGAATLMADLDEYQSIAQSMETPETKDMMICLKEIASVFAAPPENVAKIVVENLRHLDTVIVLAIVRARADFTTRPSLSHWTKKISTSYGFSKWDHSFHWEKKKQVTVMSVIETAANTEPLGPTTLRKASLSWGELELVQHQQVADGASKDEGDEEGPDGQEGQGGTGMPTITGPASFAAAIQERFAALMPQEADGSRRKLFPGVMAPELRFTFGGGEDGEGLRVGEKIAAGFEEVGEGIRNAGEKVAGGFKSGFGAVKNAVTSIGRDRSPSRPHDGGDGGGDGGDGEGSAPKPKVMVNPFKAIQVAAAVGAVGGAVTGAAGAVGGAFVRAVSPLRGGGGTEGNSNNNNSSSSGSSSGGVGDGSTPDRNKMLERVRGVFARK